MIAGVVICLLAYLLGSVPIGLLLARLKGIDIRKVGSGNIGFTNVLRAVGWRYAIPTLIFDLGKGFFPPFFALWFGLSEWVAILAGLFAICGHNWSIFLKAKGGKGVLTSCGVFLGLAPVPTLCAVGIFCLVLLLVRFVSVSSTIATISLPIFIFFISRDSFSILILALVSAIFVVVKHIPNFKRLMAGTEHKIGKR
ncbi:glycerol-3-phosphate 1-O-acyltransferase PlsY [bacterium]|nr:glycerol-3-phosphate 1-O-acyltransferase PlsY [bacterium]MBU1598801.1 glycerol-3-phosphate 1-O-acyltransferase PlsY [bacterium]MBU2461956.1 glycerol-3-phosphate 1-O-acyltransferase PlsY [bacterium]